jgi:WD40 repeat protein/tRNA A-37 threonylcarbamoyl transferase component Bud32
MPVATACPRCGSTATHESAWGVCPACALEFGLAGYDVAAISAGFAEEPTPLRGRFGDYEILGEIAQGGMGIVYRARQLSLNRLVALKMIRAGQLATAADIRRFREEAGTAARLQYPGIVAVHEVGELDGQHFFAMELVEGRSFAEVLAGNPLSPAEAARIVAQVAATMGHAHAHGVLHRDLKPSNVMLDALGQPRVLDFGLARSGESAGDPTLTGTVMGSPSYMPPEQALGRHREVTVRSDVYSLGAILYEALTGRAPFRAASAVETLRLVTGQEPVAPRELNPRLPRDLETICLRCLAKAPADRYGSAGELAEELERFRRGEPILARPVSAPERLVRWSRRHPALAGSLTAIAVLLLAVTGISVGAAIRLERARAQTAGAEAVAREQLRSALLAQARASRFTGRAGQRFEALKAAESAARIRPGRDARDEVVAALALPDVGRAPAWSLTNIGARVLFDLDRDRYLAEEPGGGLSLRGLRTHAPLARLETDGKLVRGFPVFAPSGRWLASRLNDDSFRVWVLPGGEVAWALTNRPYPDRTRSTRFGDEIVFDPQERWLSVGLPAGGLTFHETASGRELARWRSPLIAQRAAVSPAGDRLAVGDFTVASSNLFVVLVDPMTGAETGRLEGISGTRGLAWTPDGGKLAVARGGRVEIVDVPSGRQYRRLETPDGAAMDLRFDPTGEWLLSHSSRSVFRWWSVREGRVALELTEPVNLATKIGVSSDFRRVAGAGQALEVGEHRFEPSAVYRAVPPPDAASSFQIGSAIGTVDFSPDGGWVSVACLDEVHLRDANTGALVARLIRPLQSDWLTARFGADRTTVFVSSRAHGLFRYRLVADAAGRWNFDGGELLDGENDFLLCSLHRPTGRLALASARKHNAFKLLSPDGSAPTVKWPAVQAYEVAFSPDGRTLAANSAPASDEKVPRQIELRDALTGELRRTLDAGIGATARWSADGRWLLTATMPDRVDLWRTASWTRGPALPKEVQAANGTFALSPHGDLLAVFNEVETWLVRTADGELLAKLAEPPGTLGYVTDMTFSPDGRKLALLRRNAVLALWDVERLRAELESRGLGW